MIRGTYINEEIETIAESQYPFYGFIRRPDYKKETVRYSIKHFRWFATLVKNTVVNVGRAKFMTTDAILGRMLNNHEFDIMTDSLNNVAEQPDFEQDLNYFSSEEDRDKAMESYIGKMINYTATTWVRTLLQDYEKNISFESVTEDKGDSIFTTLAKDFGMDDENIQQILDEFRDATENVANDASDMYDEPEDMQDVTDSRYTPEKILRGGIFVDRNGVYKDSRFCLLVSVTVFAIAHNLIKVDRQSLAYQIYEWYTESIHYVLPSDKQDNVKVVFQGILKFGISVSDAYGFGTFTEDEIMVRLHDILDGPALLSVARFGVDYLNGVNVGCKDRDFF